MRLALGGDHRGTSALDLLQQRLEEQGNEVIRVGPTGDSPCDYPDAAFDVASAVVDGRAQLGVLICGTGIGVSIAANKVRGVRAAVVHDELTASLSRRHNDANVLCLSGDLLGPMRIERVVQAWLESEFEGGRHARRVAKIHAIESGENPAGAPD